MVFLGAGKPTVIIGLALYSLLPIVRNTCLGLNQVPDYLVEAGKGMGMSRMQRLLRVEMPLATPILFTGIRIAAVNAVGTAVFAAFVGGGGLGSVINTGIRQDDMAAILGGTGVLMLMALVLDTLMGLIEHRMNHHTAGSTSHRFRMVKRLGAAGLAVCVIAVGAWSFIPQDENGIVLYQGEFSEVQLINSMIQQLMEDRYGLEVTIKDQMTSKNNFQALIGDDHSCDLMYNWDGTISPPFWGWTPRTFPTA